MSHSPVELMEKLHSILSSTQHYIIWQISSTDYNTQPFYGPCFRDHRASQCQKISLFWTFMVQGKITEADTPTIQLAATPSELISVPPPSSPRFYAGCLSCCNPPTLSWLGAGTKYAALHIQCRDLPGGVVQ